MTSEVPETVKPLQSKTQKAEYYPGAHSPHYQKVKHEPANGYYKERPSDKPGEYDIEPHYEPRDCRKDSGAIDWSQRLGRHNCCARALRTAQCILLRFTAGMLLNTPVADTRLSHWFKGLLLLLPTLLLTYLYCACQARLPIQVAVLEWLDEFQCRQHTVVLLIYFC